MKALPKVPFPLPFPNPPEEKKEKRKKGQVGPKGGVQLRSRKAREEAEEEE